MTATTHATGVLAERSAGDVMRPGVLTAHPAIGLHEVAAAMAVHGIHALVVSPLVREEGEPAPRVITDLDVVRAAVEETDRPVTASSIARAPIGVIPPRRSLAEAARLMASSGVTHVLVQEPSDRLPSGMISTLDVIAVVAGREPRRVRTPKPAPARPAVSERSLHRVPVRAAMHPGVVTCEPSAGLAQTAQVMADHRIHCVVVAGLSERGGQEGMALGVVDDLDVVRAALDEQDTTAGRLAATELLTVSQDDSLQAAAVLMAEHGVRHVVVVGGDGAPRGVVSTRDVAAVLAIE